MICVCPFRRPQSWKHTPVSRSVEILPIQWVFTQTTPGSLLWPDCEVALNISKDWTNTHKKKWGREKSDKKRMGRNMIWGGYVHGFSINIFVRLHPTIHNNTANLMWFVEKIKCETIRQKKERNISNKSNTTTEWRKENDSAIRFYDSVLFFVYNLCICS